MGGEYQRATVGSNPQITQITSITCLTGLGVLGVFPVQNKLISPNGTTGV